LTSYTCGDRCYVVSGGKVDPSPNNIYEVDSSGTLNFIADFLPKEVMVTALTSYMCGCFLYVVAGGGSGVNVVYKVDCPEVCLCPSEESLEESDLVGLIKSKYCI